MLALVLVALLAVLSSAKQGHNHATGQSFTKIAHESDKVQLQSLRSLLSHVQELEFIGEGLTMPQDALDQLKKRMELMKTGVVGAVPATCSGDNYLRGATEIITESCEKCRTQQYFSKRCLASVAYDSIAMKEPVEQAEPGNFLGQLLSATKALLVAKRRPIKKVVMEWPKALLHFYMHDARKADFLRSLRRFGGAGLSLIDGFADGTMNLVQSLFNYEIEKKVIKPVYQRLKAVDGEWLTATFGADFKELILQKILTKKTDGSPSWNVCDLLDKRVQRTIHDALYTCITSYRLSVDARFIMADASQLESKYHLYPNIVHWLVEQVLEMEVDIPFEVSIVMDTIPFLPAVFYTIKAFTLIEQMSAHDMRAAQLSYHCSLHTCPEIKLPQYRLDLATCAFAAGCESKSCLLAKTKCDSLNARFCRVSDLKKVPVDVCPLETRAFWAITPNNLHNHPQYSISTGASEESLSRDCLDDMNGGLEICCADEECDRLKLWELIDRTRATNGLERSGGALVSEAKKAIDFIDVFGVLGKEDEEDDEEREEGESRGVLSCLNSLKNIVWPSGPAIESISVPGTELIPAS